MQESIPTSSSTSTTAVAAVSDLEALGDTDFEMPPLPPEILNKLMQGESFATQKVSTRPGKKFKLLEPPYMTFIG